MRRLLAIGGVLCLLHGTPQSAASATADAPTYFEYLHIEANSGSASGGHAAVCFDDRCFHFQQLQDGLIRLQRESAARLDHTYRALGNRPIHAYRVAASAARRASALAAFEDAYQRQESDFTPLETLQEDGRLLDHLRATSEAEQARRLSSFDVPGSGYFFADQPGSEPHSSKDHTIGDGYARSETIDHIAARIRARYGPHRLETDAAQLRRAIGNLLNASGPSTTDDAIRAGERLPAPGFAERYRDLLSALLAIEVLQTALPLAPRSTITAPRAGIAAGQSDSQAVRRFRANLEDSLVELYASRRRDWGYPMLIGLARAAAFEAAARGEPVLLDVFATDAMQLSPAELAPHRRALQALLSERHADTTAAWTAFIAAPDEMTWSRFETAANLAADLQGALDRDLPLRVHHDMPVPVKSAARRDWPRPEADPSTLQRAAGLTHERTAQRTEELAAAYGYDLVRRNCVTEILDRIDSASAAHEGVSPAPPLATALRFIPFVSAHVVASQPGVMQVDRPSYRQHVLAKLRSDDASALLRWRESNTLTTTIYESNAQDPLFLFFTDDTIAWRPLLGLVNLVYATAAIPPALLLAPADAGITLGRALNGVASSLPELAFINLRKGSIPFVPRAWQTTAR